MTDVSTSKTTEAKQQAQEVGSNAAGRAGDVVADAQEQAKAVTSQAKNELQKVWDQSRDEVAQQAQQRGQQAAGSLRTLGDRLGSLADGDTDNAGPLLDYVRDGRDRVASLADRLEQGPDAVLADVRAFARNRPMIFLACAGGLGFLAGRMVRSGASGDDPSTEAPELSSRGAAGDQTPSGGSAAVDASDRPLPPPDAGVVTGDPSTGDLGTGSALDAEATGFRSSPVRPMDERR